MSTPAERVVDAWSRQPGPCPELTYRARVRLRREWPTLARAIDELAAEQGSTPKRE